MIQIFHAFEYDEKNFAHCGDYENESEIDNNSNDGFEREKKIIKSQRHQHSALLLILLIGVDVDIFGYKNVSLLNSPK